VSTTNVIMCVASKNVIPLSLLSYSLQIVTDVIVYFSVTCRLFAEVNNYMVCAKRAHEYTSIESEDLLRKEETDK
jgi:hypothetical protein